VECDSADGRTMRIGKLNKHSRDGRSVNVVMHGDFRTFPSQPDSNGRRPKLHTIVRFASSDERHSHLSVGSPLQLNQYCQKKASSQFYSAGPDHQDSGSVGGWQPQSSSHGHQFLTPHSTVGRDQNPLETNDKLSRRNEQQSRIWYCCRQCQYTGPYDTGLYTSCVLGCGTPRCTNCCVELITIRDPKAPSK
jgi:hypothetical protein